MAITFVGYSSGEKRRRMVLEMPVMTTSAAERAQLLPERLHAAYQDLFALLQQQYRFADEARVFAFLRQHVTLRRLIETWVEAHEQELLEQWQKAQNGEQVRIVG